jgi:hypothetical protein
MLNRGTHSEEQQDTRIHAGIFTFTSTLCRLRRYSGLIEQSYNNWGLHTVGIYQGDFFHQKETELFWLEKSDVSLFW